jgi:hypothetical protein
MPMQRLLGPDQLDPLVRNAIMECSRRCPNGYFALECSDKHVYIDDICRHWSEGDLSGMEVLMVLKSQFDWPGEIPKNDDCTWYERVMRKLG